MMRAMIDLPPTSSSALLTPPRRVARPPLKISALRRMSVSGCQAARVNRVPHCPQKAWLAGLTVAQEGHVVSAAGAAAGSATGLVSSAPHAEQNLLVAGLTVWHAAHVTGGAVTVTVAPAAL
jgi:hypothetical protein